MTRDAWALVLAGLAIAFLLLLCIGAWAHDGYEDLKNQFGGACCGSQDCGPVDIRTRNGETQVHIVGPPWGDTDVWVKVDKAFELPAELNPKAGPSACYLPSRGVICYWPGRDF